MSYAVPHFISTILSVLNTPIIRQDVSTVILLTVIALLLIRFWPEDVLYSMFSGFVAFWTSLSEDFDDFLNRQFSTNSRMINPRSNEEKAASRYSTYQASTLTERCYLTTEAGWIWPEGVLYSIFSKVLAFWAYLGEDFDDFLNRQFSTNSRMIPPQSDGEIASSCYNIDQAIIETENYELTFGARWFEEPESQLMRQRKVHDGKVEEISQERLYVATNSSTQTEDQEPVSAIVANVSSNTCAQTNTCSQNHVAKRIEELESKLDQQRNINYEEIEKLTMKSTLGEVKRSLLQSKFEDILARLDREAELRKSAEEQCEQLVKVQLDHQAEIQKLEASAEAEERKTENAEGRVLNIEFELDQEQRSTAILEEKVQKLEARLKEETTKAVNVAATVEDLKSKLTQNEEMMVSLDEDIKKAKAKQKQAECERDAARVQRDDLRERLVDAQRESATPKSSSQPSSSTPVQRLQNDSQRSSNLRVFNKATVLPPSNAPPVVTLTPPSPGSMFRFNSTATPEPPSHVPLPEGKGMLFKFHSSSSLAPPAHLALPDGKPPRPLLKAIAPSQRGSRRQEPPSSSLAEPKSVEPSVKPQGRVKGNFVVGSVGKANELPLPGLMTTNSAVRTKHGISTKAEGEANDEIKDNGRNGKKEGKQGGQDKGRVEGSKSAPKTNERFESSSQIPLSEPPPGGFQPAPSKHKAGAKMIGFSGAMSLVNQQK